MHAVQPPNEACVAHKSCTTATPGPMLTRIPVLRPGPLLCGEGMDCNLGAVLVVSRSPAILVQGRGPMRRLLQSSGSLWPASGSSTAQLVADMGCCVGLHIIQQKGRPRPSGYEGGGAELEVVGGGAASTTSAGSFFHGRFRSSSVIPSSFVIPTTGASPLWTNSYCPAQQSASA